MASPAPMAARAIYVPLEIEANGHRLQRCCRTAQVYRQRSAHSTRSVLNTGTLEGDQLCCSRHVRD